MLLTPRNLAGPDLAPLNAPGIMIDRFEVVVLAFQRRAPLGK